MVQLLTLSGMEECFDGKDVVLNSFHDAQSLDEFDINIINLNEKKLWMYWGRDNSNIDTIEEFKSLSVMISNTKKTNIIILFPQNLDYVYNTENGDDQCKYIELKNMIQGLKNILSELFKQMYYLDIVYENTKTQIGDLKASASFYFNNSFGNILTKSISSDKLTTIVLGDVIVSSLNLINYNYLISFLQNIKLIKEKEQVPEWVKVLKMFDDDKQFEIIQENNEVIKAANDNILIAEDIIKKNNKFKSILYSTGEELVNVVFDILTEITGCNLSEFEDKKKEDFSFVINEITCIGEIKGISSNVKSQNISQLEFHHQGFLDDHPEVEDRNVRQLLIINHQRNVPLEKRDPVDAKQIQLAQKYESLIVETRVLLRLLEDYRAGKLTQKKCFEFLTETIGILEYK